MLKNCNQILNKYLYIFYMLSINITCDQDVYSNFRKGMNN